MKTNYILIILMVLASCQAGQVNQNTETSFKDLTPTPPMGWNSFDSYDSRINEADFKASVDILAEELLEYGWEYAVVDYIWWHPAPGNYKTARRYGHGSIRYNEDGTAKYPEFTTIDEYGRLLPAVERFPSAADGRGFKPIADYVHSKGLKFGIHIMRGIHRTAYFRDLPILGTDYTAKDIGEPFDTCNWLNQMMGVDASKPGAQEYYNSLFKLYAEWEVDFIKADDILRDKYHKGDIEMIRKAIDQCGRPMVLSLSPGEAPISMAKHLTENANMWRVSGDLWDEWNAVRYNFELMNTWAPFIGEGTWPDADMLPLGRISLDNRPHGPERWTLLTWGEQITMMNFWAITKSPLMMGGDLLTLPDSTLKLLTNREILNVNQNSIDNRQVFKFVNWGNEDLMERYTSVVWTAKDPATGDKFLALFNLLGEESEICIPLEWEELRGEYILRDLWAGEDLGSVEGDLCKNLPPHGSVMYRLKKK
jgi:alpha-galactosidase